MTTRYVRSTPSGRRQRSSGREQIYLVAAAGHPNYGDDYITRCWLTFLARRKPRAEIWLDCPEPGRAAFLFRGIHRRLHTTNTLWQMAYESTGGDAREIGEDARTLVQHLGSPRVDLGLTALLEMDTLHILGGGYVNDIWPHNVGLLASVVEAKRLGGAQVYATGQGFLPQSDASAAYLRDLLSDVDYAESRDEDGAELLGIHYGLDDAFLGLGKNQAVQFDASGLPDTMLLIQGDFFDEKDEEWLTEAMRSFIRGSHSRGHSGVGFVEAIPPTDRHFYDLLRNEYPDASFFTFQEIWEQGLPVHAGQEWFTSRFHFHLLAAAAGAAGTYVPLHPGYYDVKHRSLVDRESGWSGIELSSDLTSDALTPTKSSSFPAIAARHAAEKLAMAEILYPARRGRSRQLSETAGRLG